MVYPTSDVETQHHNSDVSSPTRLVRQIQKTNSY